MKTATKNGSGSALIASSPNLCCRFDPPKKHAVPMPLHDTRV
jgi:hypothetical protein